MSREGPEIPVAPGVDEPPCATRSWLSNRTTWPTNLVLSQGGTTIANLARYQCEVGENLGRQYSSPLGAKRCSNLVRAHELPPAAEDFDMVKAVRKMDLPSWLPLRELSSWSDYADHTTAIRGRLQGFLGAKTKGVIPGVAHRGAVPDIEHTESARWLRALSMESRLLRWIACSDFGLLHDRFIEARKSWPENSTFAHRWQTIKDRVTLMRGGGRVGKHLQPLLVPFRRLHGAQGRSAGDFLTAVPP